MKKLFQKKQWLMLSLLVALGAAVYLNYYFTKAPAVETGAGKTESQASGKDDGKLGEAVYVQAGVSTDGDYFEQARSSREKAREEALRLLEEISKSADTGDEDRKTAQEQMRKIAENVLLESDLENQIITKGFKECVVFIDADHCFVAVSSKELSGTQSAQILDLVLKRTDIPAQNIQIAAQQSNKS